MSEIRMLSRSRSLSCGSHLLLAALQLSIVLSYYLRLLPLLILHLLRLMSLEHVLSNFPFS